jgi:anti-anti-sigma factor
MLEFLGTVEAGELPGGEVVVSAHGPLDERVATSLRDTLIPLTGARDAPLFLDLEGAHGLDAAAMVVIGDAAQLVQRGGARLGIVTRSPIVLRMIRDSGFESMVDVTPTLAEALHR